MVTIIPARGGSRGLPGKNIKMLLGKPMIAYTIEAAQKSKYVSEIIVSTDSEEIAEIATKYGAKCPFLRPKELASDESLAIETYKYVVNRLNSEGGKIKEFVVLQPTSPLRQHTDIDNAIELFYEKKADSVVSYTPEKHPIAWHKYLGEENKFIDIFQSEIKNRQDYKTSYYPNGAVYVFKFEIIKEGKYYTDNSYAYIMDYDRSVDIDTIEDFELVEFLLKNKI